MPSTFGVPGALSPNNLVVRSQIITITSALSPHTPLLLIHLAVWAEAINAKGGIPIAGKNYSVELVIVDCGHSNATIELALVKKVTQDLVSGVYGRIDFIFPAYSSAYAVPTLQITDPAKVPAIGCWSDTATLRCTAPLPAGCANVRTPISADLLLLMPLVIGG